MPTAVSQRSADVASPVSTKPRTTGRSKLNAKKLYPAVSKTLFWMMVAAVRSAILCTIAVHIMHPYFVALGQSLGLSDFGAFTSMALTLHSGMILFGSLFFYACDRFHLFSKYKLTRDPEAKNEDSSLSWKSIQFVFLYHAVWRVALVAALWYVAPYPALDTELPDTLQLVWHFFSVYWFGELYNYYSHRILHESTKSWVRAAHAPHHQWRATESYAAEFSGSLEIMVYTILSYLHTCQLPMSVHFITIIQKCAENIEAHSGYSFCGSWLNRIGLLYSYRVEIHDFHHQHPGARGPFGKPLAGFDYLFGTCDEWLLHLQSQGRPALYWR